MVLSCSDMSKSSRKKHILEQVSFRPEDHEKAAVVGINDAGKSTLFRIVIGELVPDEGCVALGKGVSTGYLAQHQNLNSESTIRDALLEVKRPILRMGECIRTLELGMKSMSDESLEVILEEYSHLARQSESEGDYTCRSGVAGVLKGLGFAEGELPKPINALSSGQKTRMSLGKLLLTKSDVLLLGGPISHLDMESTAWLETYLKTHSGSVITVAHDRYFLDWVVTKITELDNGTRTVFSGSCTAYNDRKAMFRDTGIRVHLNQQQEIRHQEAVIAKLKSFNWEESIRRAEGRKKMLEKIGRLEKPMGIDDSMDIRLESDVESGKDILIITGLSKSLDGQTLLTDADFEIKHGERVTIIGNNGTGKTILLKIINQLLSVDADEVRLDSKVHIDYCDQECQALHMDKTLFDEIQDTYPNMNSTQIHNTLASFLFTGDDVFELIRDLSGGEHGRVSLAKLMFSDTNSLLLDEPINHLDIASKEILESALCHYTGTVLYVPHDRYFINRTAIRILDLARQSLINYVSSYDCYLRRKDAVEVALTTRDKCASSAPNLSQTSGRPSQGSQNDLKLEWKAQKEGQVRIRGIQNESRKTEDSIHALGTGDSEINALPTREEVYTDVSRLMELSKEKEGIAGQLEKLYQSWEELAEKA